MVFAGGQHKKPQLPLSLKHHFQTFHSESYTWTKVNEHQSGKLEYDTKGITSMATSDNNSLENA